MRSPNGTVAATVVTLLLSVASMAAAYDSYSGKPWLEPTYAAHPCPSTPPATCTPGVTGGLLGTLVSGDYNRQASDQPRARANRFDPPAGFVPATGFGNSGPNTCFGCAFNVPISNSVIEFGYDSPDQTSLTADFTAAGIMTLTRTELLSDTGRPTPSNHDPVQLTFSSLGFSNFAGIEQISTTPPSTAVAFGSGSITGVSLTTPASNGPAGVVSLRLGNYPRRPDNTVEWAQFRLLRANCTAGACCDLTTGRVKDPCTTCSPSATQTCAKSLGGFCDGLSNECQLAPKSAGTVCRQSQSPCQKDAVCDGTSLTCPTTINKPNGVPCPWTPSANYDEGYLSSSSDSPKSKPVSAKEAAAWVTGDPQYDHEWPECAGTCYSGVCSLKYGHPACCHVPHRSYDDGYYGNRYAAVEDIKDVKADLLGFWKGRDFYCWR